MRVTERLTSASNVVLRASVDGPDGEIHCVYKPAQGERPLWDFPDLVLGRHEVASYLISELLGWGLVPPTVWREDAPAGPGAVQMWVYAAVTEEIGIFPRGAVPEDFLPVLSGTDERGHEVIVGHRDEPRLRNMALLDAVINNSDRKAGHVLGDRADLVGIDHGVAFHPEDKLRTVLWGFAGQSLSDSQLTDLMRLLTSLRSDPGALSGLVTAPQMAALIGRCQRLVDAGEYPMPAPGWPAVPWPIW